MADRFIQVSTCSQEWCSRLQVAEDVKEVGEDHSKFFSTGRFGHGTVMGIEFNIIGSMFAFCDWFLAIIVAVMEHCRSDVETAGTMVFPGTVF